jgi:hypothetical protein
VAALAEIGAFASDRRVDVAAGAAALSGGRDGAGVFPRGHEDPVDDVARALVVDDRAWAELGDGQEARAGDELVALAATGDEGRKRQAREVVAGQEALAREIAVAVEVRLDEILRLGEELELYVGLVAQTAGALLLLRRLGRIRDHLVLVLELLQCRLVEAAPALAGLVEGERDLLQDLVQPALAVPVRVRKVIA